jgi:hypothetical protein
MNRKVKAIIWIEALVVALLIFSTVLLSYFGSVSTLNKVLKDSGSYSQLSEITQSKVVELIPADVKNSPIAYGAINWGVNRFITPGLIEQLATPTLNGLVRLAKTPTTIVGSEIMIDTTQYKAKLSTDVNGLNLPKSLKKAGDSFAQAIPSQLKVVDLNKRPNSVLAKVLKAKARLHQLRGAVIFLGSVAALLALLLVIWSQKTINQILRTLSVATLAGGGATLVACGLLAFYINSVGLYSGGAIIDSQVNTLLVGLSSYFLNDVAWWGWLLTLLGAFVFFFTLEKIQREISKAYQWTKKLVTPPKAS